MAIKRKETRNRKGMQAVTLCISTTMVLVLLGMETLGLWFVCTKMNCPESRYSAMLIVYQLAIARTEFSN